MYNLSLMDIPARPYRDFLPLGREHEDNLIAEAEGYRLYRRLAPGESWQGRVLSRIGRWLVVIGCKMEKYGKRQTAQSAA